MRKLRAGEKLLESFCAGQWLRSLCPLYTNGRHSIWNSYAKISRCIEQAAVEVCVGRLLMVHHETSFSRSQGMFGDAAVLTVVVVLAIGTLAKLDSTIQLFHLGQ